MPSPWRFDTIGCTVTDYGAADLRIFPPACTTTELRVVPDGVVSWQLKDAPLRTVGCIFHLGAGSKGQGASGNGPASDQNSCDALLATADVARGRGSMLIRSCQLGQSRFTIEKARGEPSVRP